MALLPPQPIGVAPGHSLWNDWYEKLRDAFNSGQIATTWSAIDFSGSNITDIVNRAHANLQSLQGGTAGEHYHLTSAQHTTVSSLPTLTSGTYTPTLFDGTNVDASTAYSCQYMRVGSVVTVSGRLDVDPNTISTLTEIGISLPIASAFSIASGNELGGTASAADTVYGATALIRADQTNDRAHMQFIIPDTDNRAWFFSFTYRII